MTMLWYGTDSLKILLVTLEKIVTTKRNFLIYYKKTHGSLVPCTGDVCSATSHEYWDAVNVVAWNEELKSTVGALYGATVNFLQTNTKYVQTTCREARPF